MASIPTLATPSFMSGTNSALAVADVYDLVSPGVITDIESILSDIASISNSLLGSGLLSALEDTSSSLTPVSVSSGSATSGVTTSTQSSSTQAASGNTAQRASIQSTPVDLNTLLARLGTTSSQLNTAIRGLSTNAQNTMTLGLNNNASSSQQVTLNGVSTTVSTAAYSDIAQVAAIINSFTGVEAAAISSDTQAFASIISGIVQICANLGLPNSFAAITSQITDIKILTLAVTLCLEATLAAGDLQSIASMANKLSSSVVIAIYPTIIQTYVNNFTTNYYTMLGYDTAQAKATLAYIVSLLGQIDPNWNYGVRDGVSLIDVNTWMSASPTFTQLVTNAAKQAEEDPSSGEVESTGDIFDQTNALAYLFAANFGSKTVIEELESTYPMVKLTTNEAVALAIDPSSMISA